MRQYLLLVVVLFVLGCGEPPSTKVRKDKEDSTIKKVDVSKKKASASDYWISLAETIEAEELISSEYLAATVVQLANTGKLTAGDVKQFNDAFPGIQKGDRALTKEDAKTLRSLK